MAAILQVLLVEDNPDDAKLIERELRKSGLEFRAERVETAAAAREALGSQHWDVVLADFALPTFRGVEVLSMLREVDANTPFVIVSGAIDADTALEAMKAGAADYVLKADLIRLPTVVERELEAAAARLERSQAELERDRVLLELRTAYTQVRDLAAENARLYEAEHRIAETLQDALLVLPFENHALDYVVRYISAAEHARVGGDFYDIFDIDDWHVGVVIGDVSGKGLEAAALAAMVRNVIRATAVDCPSPASVMTKTSNVVYRFTVPEVFVTVFFAVVDTRVGSVVYVSAGHPPALVKRLDGSVKSLETLSSIAGAFPHTEYVETSTMLRDGDMLFLHTDGLSEARSNGGEFYGEERLVVALSRPQARDPQSVIDAVFEDVQAFAGLQHRDDMALVAIRWNA